MLVLRKKLLYDIILQYTQEFGHVLNSLRNSCAYSSEDRAPVSGTGSAGSIPARRTMNFRFELVRTI